MSLFSFITDINGHFEIATALFIKFNKDLQPPVYFDPPFIRHLRVILVNNSFSFFGFSLSASQPSWTLFLQKLRKYVINLSRAPVTSSIIESDALYSQTVFYDVKTEVLYFWRKSYNADILL